MCEHPWWLSPVDQSSRLGQSEIDSDDTLLVSISDSIAEDLAVYEDRCVY